MLRRRNTASSPCDVSRCASDEPRRCLSLSSALDPSSLPHLPLRRVFLRSICARRHSVSELNLACGRFAANWERATLAPACAVRPVTSVDMPSWRRCEFASFARQICRELCFQNFIAPTGVVLWYNVYVSRERGYGAKGRNPMRRKTICAAKRSPDEM